MLLHIAIKNIVLVDYVTLNFDSGFSAFTGETGAGKSIILDSISFAIGAKVKKNFICNNAEFGEVIACFDISKQAKLIAEFGTDKLNLKRIQYKNGKTQCFINDKASNLTILKIIGEQLIEFHGQHADRELLKKSEHLRLLDEYANIKIEKEKLAQTYNEWQTSQKLLFEKINLLELANKEQDYLKNAYIELEALNIQPGEELELSTKRSLMLKQQKLFSLIAEIQNILDSTTSPSTILTDIWRKLDRNIEQEYTKSLLEHIDVALNDVAIIEEEVNNVLKKLEFDVNELEKTEERLFTLRAASRKYDMQIEDLPKLYEKITQKIYLIENAELELEKAQKQQQELKETYLKEAKLLSKMRAQAADLLANEVMQELPSLKLEHAKFLVLIETNENLATKNGIDNVEFWVQTNPNTQAGSILEVASGGELSRFLLALKVVLFNKNIIPTIIFDEIDTGLSGAVAASIGLKLNKIAKNVQLIAITHLAQVAAKADTQFLIDKKLLKTENKLTSTVKKLNKKERIEEIARMISGDEITKEARASAQSLIEAK